jgi:rhomboid protease GluP
MTEPSQEPSTDVVPAEVPVPAAATRPWVTYVLAAANVAVWIVTLALGASAMSPSAQWLFDHGGNLGARTLSGEPWRLFTSMFLHAGVFHLAMNLIGLVGGGKLVERLYGRLGFAVIYLIAGLAGSLATALRPGVVSVGASGAIFGVLGATGAYFLLHRERMDASTLRESRGLLAAIAYNVVFGLSQTGIDMVAHTGGLVGGFAVGLALELRRSGSPHRRALVVGAVGLAAMIAAALLAPAPDDPMEKERAAFNAFGAIEQRVDARWMELVGQAREDKITDDAFADAIEQDVLGPWRAGIEAFERSGAGGDRRAAVLHYIHGRAEGWELVTKGLRAHDSATVQRGVERLKEAATTAEQALRP